MTSKRSFSSTCIFVLCFVSCYTLVHLENCSDICTTPACVQLAAQILLKIEESVHPCDDFYDFACGRYPEDTTLARDGKTEIAFQSAHIPMYEKLKEIVENSMDDDENSIAYKRKLIYNSCINFQDMHTELMLMKKRLSEYYIPNWPDVDAESDIDEWLVKLSLADAFSFIHIDITFISQEIFGPYFENRGMTFPPNINRSLEVRQRVLSTSLFDICSDFPEDDLPHFIYSVLEDMGFSEEVGEQIIDDAIHVDGLLQNITRTDYNETNYESQFDCTNASTTNRWCKIFKLIIERTKTEGDFNDATFKFTYPGVFLALDELLNNISSKDIGNYLAVHFLLDNLGTLNYFTQYLNFPCKISLHRWEEFNFVNPKFRCIYFIVRHLPNLVSADYITAHEIPKNLVSLKSVLKEIINVTKEIIDTSWMSEEERLEWANSLSKTTVNQLDYVPYIISISDIKTRYMDLKPDPDHFFLNLVAVKTMGYIDDMRVYKDGHYNRNLIQLNPFNVNAASGEDISFGFGFYEIPYTEPSLQTFVDFARFGYPLGHEIIHNLHYILHSSESNATTFRDYETCVVELYSKFSIPIISVPSKSNFTFGENFADLFGKHIAYEGYLNYISQHGQQPKLPGLSSFSSKQLFFLLAAQDWCEFGNDYESYLKNPHSPSVHRILGPSMNMESFSDAYNCKAGSAMNPVKKCKLGESK